MKPYYQRDGITIYHANSREVLPSLRADAVVTDPPYGLDFQGEGWDAGIPSWWLRLARECAPLVAFTTAPTTVWAYPCPDWVLCWSRPGSTSRTAYGGFNHWSPVLVYGRGSWSPDHLRLPDIVRVNENAGIDHPCPKPESLMRWLVNGSCRDGGTVCDPFMGSGTTLVAAALEGRQAIGIEIEERYCEIAAKRLDQGVLPFTARATS